MRWAVATGHQLHLRTQIDSTCKFFYFKGFGAHMFMWYTRRMFHFRNLVSTVMRLYSFLSLADTTACTLQLAWTQVFNTLT